MGAVPYMILAYLKFPFEKVRQQLLIEDERLFLQSMIMEKLRESVILNFL